MPEYTWDRIRLRIGDELRMLDVDQGLVVEVPQEGMRPQPSFWEKFFKPQGSAPPYVQYLRHPEGYAAECVSELYRPEVASAHQALLDFGWTSPGRMSGFTVDNYSRMFDLAQWRAAAEAGVEALALLGCTPRSEFNYHRIA